VLHVGIPYDPIEGQSQDSEPSNLEILSFFKVYLRHLQCELATDY